MKFVLFSERRCRVRNLRQVSSGADGAAGIICGALDRGAGRAHDRSAGVEKFRAATARAATLVGGPGSLRGLYNLRDHVQPDAPGLSLTRASVRVRPADQSVYLTRS